MSVVLLAAKRVMATAGTHGAAGVVGPPRCMPARIHFTSAAVLAQAFAQELRVDITADEVMAEAQRTAPAAGVIGLPTARLPRCHFAPTTLFAKACRNALDIGNSLFHERLEPLFPSLRAQLRSLLSLHAASLLVNPRKLPSELRGHCFDARLLGLAPKFRVRHKPLDMLRESHLAMNLRFLCHCSYNYIATRYRSVASH